VDERNRRARFGGRSSVASFIPAVSCCCDCFLLTSLQFGRHLVRSIGDSQLLCSKFSHTEKKKKTNRTMNHFSRVHEE
jgi:hypothetical protein